MMVLLTFWLSFLSANLIDMVMIGIISVDKYFFIQSVWLIFITYSGIEIH
jgi:hypothetical protein